MKDLRGKKFLSSLFIIAVICAGIFSAIPAMAAAKHSTVLNGQDYKYVYDYTYYTTKVHTNLAGKSDKVVLTYFVNNGMNKQEQAISTFNVKSYRRGNQDLRKAFGMDYKSYYLHYQNYGHSESSRANTTTGVTKIKNPVTVYEGFDYKKVYNYEYYIAKNPSVGKAYPEDDIGALAHFVNTGMARQQQAISTFNVKSYRYGNADLRVKFKTSYYKYYRHYCKYGYKYAARRKTATGITSIKNPITTYNGVDYSNIYNFKYYTTHNPTAAKFKDDDASAIQNFIKRGIIMGLQAKSGVTRSSKIYIETLLKLYPSALNDEYVKANQNRSMTKYLILLNQGKHTVYIFQGKQYAWEKIKTYPCCIGAPGTSTPVGSFTIGSRGLYFITETGTKCWYFTQIVGSILFHSQIYANTGSPSYIVDGRMGVACSHGCVRLYLDNAYWINQNIPRGTKVVSYNRPW